MWYWVIYKYRSEDKCTLRTEVFASSIEEAKKEVLSYLPKMAVIVEAWLM